MDPEIATSSTVFESFLASQKAKWRAKRTTAQGVAAQPKRLKPTAKMGANTANYDMHVVRITKK